MLPTLMKPLLNRYLTESAKVYATWVSFDLVFYLNSAMFLYYMILAYIY